MATAAVIGVFAASSYNGTSFRIQGRKTITLDHIFNGTFSVERHSLHWVPEGMSQRADGVDSSLIKAPLAGDGVFSEQQDGNIILVDLKTGTNKTLVRGKDVQDVR